MKNSIGCLEYPSCTESDYERIEGECVDGFKNITYAWKQPLNCKTSRI